ncbi:MAG: hypothetical protein FJ098_14555, partial [Deltaproteobacteria bacterium]|nr:hypothetical protein [Deltaproteobacteria bacterium]
VFFTSPPGHFELMPEPVPTPGEDPAGVEPGEQGAGTCSLRALQRAVEPVSQGLRACRGSGDLDRPLLLSVRWSGEGHLELLATDPPQPDETVRCFRAALGESATPRDGDCTASLLLPSVRPATGDGPL